MQWRSPPTPRPTSSSRSSSATTSTAPRASTCSRTLADYVAGINQYIDEAKLDRTKMPGEYAAIGQPARARPVEDHRRDRHGLAGRRHLRPGRRPRARPRPSCWPASQKRFGETRGTEALEAASARSTIPRRRSRSRASASRTRRRRSSAGAGSVAIPDDGSVTDEPVVASERSSARAPLRSAAAADAAQARRPAGPSRPKAMSNALLVSARSRPSGHPLAVFGPQIGYFAPQILMEQDVHAPGHRRARRRVPGRQPVRPARPRPRLRLERHLGRPGHHRHVRRRPVQRRRLAADLDLGPLHVPRPVPPDRGARAHELLDARRLADSDAVGHARRCAA